jgi:endoglucanase
MLSNYKQTKLMLNLLTKIRTMNKYISLLLFTAITSARVLSAQSPNYAEVLQKSMFFYECQESGQLWNDNRVTWRSHSALNDGSDAGVDLTGGWYDAGDHVKFNFPMAFTATVLAWGGIDFKEGYELSGQLQYLKRNLRWVNDYFIKCHTAPNELYGQVGNGGTDHAWWGSAEVMRMERPAYKIDASNPGSDLAGETAAAMAAASIIFKDDDPSYSQTLLNHAIELYNFADSYRGVYSNSITDAAGYYRSYSGYNDELVWGAIWLFRATSDSSYLNKAEDYYNDLSTEPQSTEKSYKWGLAWDDKSYGCYALLAKLTGKEKYKTDIERHLDYWTNGYNGNTIAYTPGGLAYLDVWGALRYSANTSFLAAYYSDIATTQIKAETYYNFAVDQLEYILGDNPQDRSYVCGYGVNPPANPHHRTAHGCWSNNQNGPPDFSRHVLYGALVGGPNNDDSYADERSNYTNNEVACDYNACFSGLLAKMVEDKGGSSLSGFPVVETPEDEYYVESKFNAEGTAYSEWAVWVYNHTAWPARTGSQYSFRIFIDITEGVQAGYSVDDYTVSSNNSVVEYTSLLPWDENSNIYYTEVTFNDDIDIWPGGQGESSEEAQMRIRLPYETSSEAWDPSNDWSSQGVDGTLKQNSHIPLYVDGILVYGQPPSEPVPVESISLSVSFAELEVGGTLTILATVLPEDATNKEVQWSSSDNSITTVNSDGLVTAISAGETTVTANSADGNASATCSITVNEPPYIEVDSITVTPSEAEIDINESIVLSVTIYPEDATDQSLFWSSSDSSVATTDNTGRVTGVSQGTAEITVSTSNPDVRGISVITVTDEVIIPPTYELTITIVGSGTVTPDGGSYEEGTSVTLTAVPDEGYLFNGWSGDYTGSDSPIIIEMDSDKNITATFIEKPSGTCDDPQGITLPFTQNGAGDFCWVISEMPAYINSWNLELLEINGVDYTNDFVSSFPDPIDGNYYIRYIGNYDWSHVEMTQTKSGKTTQIQKDAETNTVLFPNPFKETITIKLHDMSNVKQIIITDMQGQVISSFIPGSDQISTGQNLSCGTYLLIIQYKTSQKVYKIIKE